MISSIIYILCTYWLSLSRFIIIIFGWKILKKSSQTFFYDFVLSFAVSSNIMCSLVIWGFSYIGQDIWGSSIYSAFYGSILKTSAHQRTMISTLYLLEVITFEFIGGVQTFKRKKYSTSPPPHSPLPHDFVLFEFRLSYLKPSRYDIHYTYMYWYVHNIYVDLLRMIDFIQQSLYPISKIFYFLATKVISKLQNGNIFC